MAKYTINMIPKRRTALINAWREFAADESFAGMTLAEFEAQTLPVVTIRTEIEQTLAKLAGQRRVRNALDAEVQTKILAVVNTVLGAPGHGPDSPMYRAIGYVAKSERASGLTRANAKSGEEGSVSPSEPVSAPAPTGEAVASSDDA